MALLDIKDLSFTYSGTTEMALESVDLQVERGDLVLICGPSGCGKTTLLRLLKKQIAPTGRQTGDILFEGVSLSSFDDTDSARKIGFVFQDTEEQTVTESVWHELAFGLESLGVPTDKMRRKIAEICGFFGITDWYRKPIDQLSGGQKQIVSLASVLVMDPEILILDEPTSMLDPIAAGQLINVIRRIREELGITVIIAEHHLEELFALADRVVLMDQGRVLAQGTPRDLGQSFARSDIPSFYAKGFPASLRIFTALKGEGEAPLSVREGKRYLVANYQNVERILPKASYQEPAVEAIRIENGYFRYTRESEDVLRGLDLTVYENEILCILGANGVGKSTLLRMLCGIHRLWSGKYRLWGEKIKHYTEQDLYGKYFALLPQDPKTLFVCNRVIDDLREAIGHLRLSKKDAEQRITELTSLLELEKLLERHPYDLSGGERQRAALAKLLLTDKRILLLDEPTKGLDADAKERLANLLRELKKQGKTIVIVTHDVEFAALYSDRCAMFFDGEITSVSPCDEFFVSNRFYTTAALRISAPYYQNAVTVEDVAALCERNGRKILS